MTKVRFILSLGIISIANVAAPAHAIYTWNGSATYICKFAATCTVTANNFQLDFSSSRWNDVSTSTGSLVLSNGTLSYTVSNGSLYFDDLNVTGNSINNNTGFTLSKNPFTYSPGSWLTFVLDQPVNNSPGQISSLYALVNPTDTRNVLNPNTSQTAVFSTTIYGQSGPAPLGILAVLPFVNLLRKRRFQLQQFIVLDRAV